MDVIRRSSQELVLQERPWLAWLLGGFFALSGLTILPLVWLLMPKDILICTRSLDAPSNCQLMAETLLGTDITNIAVEQIIDVRLEKPTVNGQTRERTDSHIVRLDLQSGDAVYFGQYDPYPASFERAEQIRRFLADPTATSLRLEQDLRWVAWIITPIFLIVGLALVFLMGTTLVIEMNKTLGTLTIQHRGLVGTKSLKEYPLRDIESVIVERSRSDKGSDTFRVAVVLNSGTKVALRSYYSSGQQAKIQTAQQIREFLGLG